MNEPAIGIEHLEQLLGQKPAAPVDVSQQRHVETETRQLAERRERVAAAGGELLGAAINLVGELVSSDDSPDPAVVEQIRAGLAGCTEQTSDGRTQLRFSLEGDDHLNRLATTFAKLLVPASADNSR